MRPDARSANALSRTIVENSNGEVDEALARQFLDRFRAHLQRHTVEWDSPLGLGPSPPSGEISMHGREKELERLRAFVSEGHNVAIRGTTGLGKTLLMKVLQAEHPGAISVRLGHKGNAMLKLRLALHSRIGGEFPRDDAQGIAQIAIAYEKGGLLLVDEADRRECAEAVRELADQVPLTVVVTSRAQPFPGFKSIDLEPLEPSAAEALVADEQLSPGQDKTALERGKGNPQQIKQAAAALRGGEVADGPRLESVVGRIREQNPKLIHLIAALPSATPLTALLTEVGGMGLDEYTLLKENAVLDPSGDRSVLHELLREECRQDHSVVHQDELRDLLEEVGAFYVQWLETEPGFDPIDEEFEVLLFLLDKVENAELTVELVLALTGDRLDDPAGYLPSRGRTRFFQERRERLQQAAAKLGDVRSAQLEKNLGLFCHRSDDPAAQELVLSARLRFQAAEHDEGCAGATWILGIIADASCHYTEAERLYREPLEWLQDPDIRAIGQHLVGCSLYHQERYEDARQAFEQARAETDDQVLQARIKRRLLCVELQVEDPKKAIAGLERARKDAERLNRPRDVARISRHIGVGYLKLDKPDKAEDHFDMARIEFERLADMRGLGATYLGMATMRRMQNKIDEAVDFAEKSRKIARGNDDAATVRIVSPVGLARVAEEEGRIAAQSDEPETVVAKLRRACNIYEAIGHRRAGRLEEELEDQRDAQIPRQPKGILFDVADTLAETSPVAYAEAKAELARRLGVDGELFMATWVRSRRRASKEVGWTPRDRIAWVAKELGVEVDEATLDELAEGEKALWTKRVSLKSDAMDVLKRIRACGIQIGLVTNGPSAMSGLPDALGLTQPLVKTSVMSCVAGMLKPERGIYERALKELGLSPEECIFVGDGNDRELNGAQAVGLFAVRMQSGEMPAYNTKQSLNWDATVHSLTELAEHLGV